MGGWPYMALHLPAAVGRRVDGGVQAGELGPGLWLGQGARRRAGRDRGRGLRQERLSSCTSPTAASRSLRSGAAQEQVALGWLAERLRDFVDEHPDAEATVDQLASWLARLDDDSDE